MKTLIVIFLALSAINLFSQDIEPPRHKFRWGVGGSDIYLSNDSTYFKQRNVLLGWHWGAPRRISEALLASQNDAYRTVNAEELTDSCDAIVKPEGYTHAVGGEILNARAFQYEPTLNINPNDPLKLNKRSGDTTRPIFGFLNRRGRVLTNPGDPNFNRLILQGDSLRNQVVLSEAWPQTESIRS